MEASLQAVFAIVFLVLGLSHFLQPRAWFTFFELLHAKGEAGVLVIALITLPPGLLIVVYHPVWTGIPLLLTLIGWGYLIKSAVYLTYPGMGLRVLSGLSEHNTVKFRWAGIALLVCSAALFAELYLLGE